MPDNGNRVKYPPITLGGRTYTVRFTMAEVEAYEAETGLTVIPTDGQQVATALLNRTAKNLLRLALVGIRGGGATDVTLESLAASMEMEELPQVAAIMDLALLKIFPQLRETLNQMQDQSGKPRMLGDQAEQRALKILGSLEGMNGLPVIG